jgi:hypothetical protein
MHKQESQVLTRINGSAFYIACLINSKNLTQQLT